MDEKIADVVAGTLLPRLTALALSEKQALLQLSAASGEYEGRWRLIVYLLGEKIRMEERRIAARMGLLKFKVKKGGPE